MKPRLTFVSAGAGSGKTHRLTEILREKLSSGAVHPAGIVATTFTRKAATELRERSRGHLLKTGNLQLADAMGQSLIGTVNGVCQSLLKRFCFEAGLSPDLHVLEEAEAARLLKQCLEESLDEATIRELNSVAWRMGIEDWKNYLAAIISQARSNEVDATRLEEFAKRNIDELLVHFGKPSSKDLDAELIRLVSEALPALTRAAEGSTIKKTADCIRLLEDILGKLRRGTYNWSDWPKVAAAEPQKNLTGHLERIRECAASYLSHARLQGDVRTFISLAFGLSAQTLASYAARKRDLGALDFIDQEVLLLKTLDNPTVAQTLREELDLLLVDEFQDTSPVQLALFMKLTTFSKETYWVGDIKQAIYGFRGSDSKLMEAVVAALPELGGAIEILDRSWRSRPALVSLINEVYSPAFSPLPPEQICLTAQRAELSEESAYELWQLEGKTGDLRVESLAGHVRTLLGSKRQVVDKESGHLRPLRPGDVAVLCRSHTRVASVLEKFSAAGVPYATGLSGLLTRPECVLALACLRRLNDTGDTIATAEILSLADCLEPEQWLADRLKYLAEGGAPADWQESGEAVHPLLATISQIRTELKMLSPREAMERVVSGCDLASLVIRWCTVEAEARQRVANIDQLINLTADYEESCRTTSRPGSLTGLLLWLENLADAQEDRQPTLAADAVQVLTHHAAKGLEWPVVILLDLENELRDRYWGVSAESDGPLNIDAPLNERFIRFRPWPFGKTTKVPLRDITADSSAGRAARIAATEEERRLLYVSMTRARDLMIFAVKSTQWDDEQWLSVTQAPWLLQPMESGQAKLPSGVKIPAALRVGQVAESGSAATSNKVDLHWFKSPARAHARLPLHVFPSSAAPIPFAASSPIKIGVPVVVARGFDVATVGTTMHAIIAAGLGESGPLSVDESRELLTRHGISGAFDPAQVHAFVDSLRKWIAATWPSAEIHAELPIRARMPNGQIATGQIDLMLERADCRIILDHKTGLTEVTDLSTSAGAYAGQLAAYGAITGGISAASSQRSFLVLTAAGSVVELSQTSA